MKKIIGTVTTYHGTEIKYLKGLKVRIVAVFKDRAKPGIDEDDTERRYLDDDIEVERFGGVTVFDRIEVQPFIEEKQRFSFVTSDPKATDLAIFKGLAK